jgi:hypothetical protein
LHQFVGLPTDEKDPTDNEGDDHAEDQGVLDGAGAAVTALVPGQDPVDKVDHEQRSWVWSRLGREDD